MQNPMTDWGSNGKGATAPCRNILYADPDNGFLALIFCYRNLTA